MSYSAVMVYVDREQPNDACFAVAGGLAEKFDAAVIGITACEISQSAYFAVGGQAAKLFEESREALRHSMAETERQFRRAFEGRSRHVSWRCAIDYPTEFVIREARAADIIVTGAIRGGDIVDPLRQLNLGDLLMAVGRPVLVVPSAAEWLDARVIMIAWKDTREARRAVADALPLLHRAREVRVVEVPEDRDAHPAALQRARDVAEWLTRRGIDATARAPQRHGDAVSQIEEAAANCGASIIVAGAYGHSRLREWALGGVTRHLITAPKRCALLSH